MEQPKQFLYHRVPEKMVGEELVPLNAMRDTNPALYAAMAKKYEGREHIMHKPVVSLEGTTWTDVIHMAAVDPKELKQALLEAGVDPKQLEKMQFYQIDPELLDPKQTTIFLKEYDSEKEDFKESFVDYDPKRLAEHAHISDATKQYYKDKIKANEKPLYFLGVPHILHKGTIQISDCPIVEV